MRLWEWLKDRWYGVPCPKHNMKRFGMGMSCGDCYNEEHQWLVMEYAKQAQRDREGQVALIRDGILAAWKVRDSQ